MAEIKLDQSVIDSIIKSADQALIETTIDVLQDTIDEQVVPYDTGLMEIGMRVVPTGTHSTAIIADATNPANGFEYPAYVYFHPESNSPPRWHIHQRTPRNPNARNLWWDEWIKGEKKDFARQQMLKHLKDKL